MNALLYKFVRRWLRWKSLVPKTHLARVAVLLLALDIIFFGIEKLSALITPGSDAGLSGWINVLAFGSAGLFLLLWARWLRRRLMWRLRNRLIVTYVFIGVIPVALLLAMGMIAGYLVAGQFATFVTTSDIQAEWKSLEASNSGIAAELAADLTAGMPSRALKLRRGSGLEQRFPGIAMSAWLAEEPILLHAPVKASTAIPKPLRKPDASRAIVRDGGQLFLRAAITMPIRRQELTVISSVPFDGPLLSRMVAGLGEITFTELKDGNNDSRNRTAGDQNQQPAVSRTRHSAGSLPPVISAGSLPAARTFLDREVNFVSTSALLDWNTGATSTALLSVRTRPSLLYSRLFLTIGDFANLMLVVLIAIAVFFAIIELFALLIGIRLTRTMTRSVAALYGATQKINRGDFSHRIEIKSEDQLAALETSFNSMTESLQRLLTEQKEKQRLEDDLAIAHEVQTQLFPRELLQLQSLEVHGLCRPARTVSGDYYDFVPLGTEQLAIAVGDVSGKGISAALLMATIHSAVRAYILHGTPAFAAPLAVTAGAARETSFTWGNHGNGISASRMLSLLNHQLFLTTALEKYATFFFGLYDGASRTLSYSNAGHLPPVIIGSDGSLRRLEIGGMVIGLFDEISHQESAVDLRSGDIFVAFSDGLTEPENEFGEFGEDRLIELVRDNRHLPLVRISEIAASAVQDWIADSEQPDDITLVLARAR